MKKKALSPFITASLLLSSCGDYFERYTPIEYCYFDVCANYEDYFDKPYVLPYSYKEVHSKNGMEQEWKELTGAKKLYLFEVVVYLEERADIWFGGVLFSGYGASMHGEYTYSPSECLSVDMDFMYSFEYMLDGDLNG